MEGGSRTLIGSLRTYLTRYINQLREFVGTGLDLESAAPDQLKKWDIFLEKISHKMKETSEHLQKLHSDWNALIAKSPIEKEAYETWISTYGDYRVTLKEGAEAIEKIANLRWLIAARLEFLSTPRSSISQQQQIHTPTIPQDETSHVSHIANRLHDFRITNTNANNTVFHNMISDIKLPKISILPFDGEKTKWLNFFQSFDELIHKQPLRNIMKFCYLKSYLRGDALQLIDGIVVSDENYEMSF